MFFSGMAEQRATTSRVYKGKGCNRTIIQKFHCQYHGYYALFAIRAGEHGRSDFKASPIPPIPIR